MIFNPCCLSSSPENYPDELPVFTLPVHLRSLGLHEHLERAAKPLLGSAMLYPILDAAKEWIQGHSLSVGGEEVAIASPSSSCAVASEKDDRAVCKFFAQGKCRFGDQCRNRHPGTTTGAGSKIKSGSHAKSPKKDDSQTGAGSKIKSGSHTKSPKKDDSQTGVKATTTTTTTIHQRNGDPSKLKSATQQKKEKDGEVSDAGEKKNRMRTATEVISRILWDNDLQTKEFTIGYLDRFTGIQEKPFDEFSWEDIASVGPNVLAIPKHRIQYFKFRDQIIWDKRSQTDDFFGSRGGKSIQEIIAGSHTNRAVPTETEEAVETTEFVDQVGEMDLLGEDSDDDDESNGDGSNSAAGGKQFAATQARPNHFVCLHVTDERVKSYVQEIQKNVTRLTPQLSAGFIPPCGLHVTLCMVRLADREIELAKQVLKNCQKQFTCLLPRCAKLVFNGVDNFRQRLIYVKVEPNPPLRKFASHLMEQFQLAGIKTPGNHAEFTPHMTIVKLSRPLAKELHMTQLNPAWYEPYAKASVGSQTIEAVHLCAMRGPRQDDGFYLRHGSISNTLLGLSDHVPTLMKGRVAQLRERGYVTEHEQEQLLVRLDEVVQLQDNVGFDNLMGELSRWNKEADTLESSMSKVDVVVMRGLPGSGKSFIAHAGKEVSGDGSAEAVNETSAIISADDFFTHGGSYKFKPELAPKAHLDCHLQFLKALADEKELIVIDNTNSQKWEYRTYCYLSEILGLNFYILEIPCHSPNMVSVYCGRNRHSVPMSAALWMYQRWERDDNAILVPPMIAFPLSQTGQVHSKFSLRSLYQPASSCPTDTLSPLAAVYIGVFLTPESQWQLCTAFAPSHQRVYASHVTLAFDPSSGQLRAAPVGKMVKVHVTGILDSEHIQVATVGLPHKLSVQGQVAHITISTDGSPPKAANSLLKKQVAQKCQPIILEGMVGVLVREATDEEKQGMDAVREKLLTLDQFTITSRQELHSLMDRIINCDLSKEVEGLKPSPAEDAQQEAGILVGDIKITQLFIFDFDGTLFIPPGPAEGRKLYERFLGKKWPHKGWLSWPESLLPPMKALPGPALPDFHSHLNRGGSCTIVLTGRTERTKSAILKVLEDARVYPERVICKPDATSESTASFKAHVVRRLLQEFPDVTLVKFWDDLPENLSAISYLGRDEKRELQLETIDATKMPTAPTNKQGKKAGILGIQQRATPLGNYQSVLEEDLAINGLLPGPEYQMAAQEGIHFIAAQFSQLLGYSGPPANLVYPFGSFLLGRVSSDIDLCLIASSSRTNIGWIEALAFQLQSCGIRYIHVGYSSRCPRLKVMLQFPNAPGIEFDIVIAIVHDEKFFSLTAESQISAEKVAEMRKSGDTTSKIAFDGHLFLEKLKQKIQGVLPLSQFGAVLEMASRLFAAKREKGNAYHCLRTYHLVCLLAESVQAHSSDLGPNPNCDRVFQLFVDHVAQLPASKFEALFEQSVPEHYLPRIMAVFSEASAVLAQGGHPSHDCYEQLLRRPDFPPKSHTRVEIKLTGSNKLLMWQARAVVEARLPSYIRQLVERGLNVIPDGNPSCSDKFCFAVLTLKSSRETLQRILRPFWNELEEYRKKDGVNIHLTFGHPDDASSPSKNSSSNDKNPPFIDQVTSFASSSRKELHLSPTLSSCERMLVHEAAERFGLLHKTVGSGKDRHLVLKKH